MKICVRTYRIFYVARAGDFLWVSKSREPAQVKKRGDWYQKLLLNKFNS